MAQKTSRKKTAEPVPFEEVARDFIDLQAGRLSKKDFKRKYDVSQKFDERITEPLFSPQMTYGGLSLLEEPRLLVSREDSSLTVPLTDAIFVVRRVGGEFGHYSPINLVSLIGDSQFKYLTQHAPLRATVKLCLPSDRDAGDRFKDNEKKVGASILRLEGKIGDKYMEIGKYDLNGSDSLR